MHNLLFFLWVLLYPLLDTLDDCVRFKYFNVKTKDNLLITSSFIKLAIHVFVGYLLYNN